MTLKGDVHNKELTRAISEISGRSTFNTAGNAPTPFDPLPLVIQVRCCCISTPTHPSTCIHTCVHTYLRTYILAYIHTCIHTYLRTYIHAYIHTCVHTYLRTYILCVHTYLRTYILAYIHTLRTYIHAYIHCVHTYLHTYVLAYIHTCVHTYFAYIHTCVHTYFAYIHTCVHTYIHAFTHQHLYHRSPIREVPLLPTMCLISMVASVTFRSFIRSTVGWRSCGLCGILRASRLTTSKGFLACVCVYMYVSVCMYIYVFVSVCICFFF